MNSKKHSGKVIGILALQGDFEAHRKMLEDQLHQETLSVRTPAELEQVAGLVLPGGESTTIIKLMNRIGLDKAIRERVAAGMPVFGTCAGLILLAKSIEDRPEQPTLSLMDITVARNAFGRQVDSFEAEVPFGAEDEVSHEVRGVFIRAPYVTASAPSVQVLSRYQDRVVGVQQNHLLGTAFHPELTEETGVHSHFVRMVAESQEDRS